jgi:uncharacterized protein YjiS (DUF1127 family)
MLKFLKRVLKAIEKAQQKRADYYMLTKFTDRELRDIGIGRSQIRDVIYNDK